MDQLETYLARIRFMVNRIDVVQAQNRKVVKLRLYGSATSRCSSNLVSVHAFKLKYLI